MLQELLQEGHTQSVLCLDVVNQTVISGGESGELALWDLSTKSLVNKSSLFPDSDCLAVCFFGHGLYISAAFGNQLHVIGMKDITKTILSLPPCDDEINQIVTNSDGSLIAVCIDTGDVQLYKVSTQNSLPVLNVYRTLRNKHSNICSTACFRFNHPSELFSGSFDCQLIHWDFSKIRCLNLFNMQEIVGAANSDSGAYMINPSFVHSLDVSPNGNTLVCGLGNGSVSIFDSSKKNIRHVQNFLAHSQHVSQTKFIDANRFLTGGNDGYIKMWSVTGVTAQSQLHARVSGGGNSSASTAQTNGLDSVDTHASGDADAGDDPGADPGDDPGGDPGDDPGDDPGGDPGGGSLNIPVKSIHHRSKVNWLVTVVNDDTSVTIIVADPSTDITVYKLE